jgi:hypothetical protein
MVIFPAASLEESSLTSQNVRPWKPAPEPLPGCRIMTGRFTPQSTGQSRPVGYSKHYTTFLRELPGDTSFTGRFES